jgi:hypothetical protein
MHQTPRIPFVILLRSSLVLRQNRRPFFSMIERLNQKSLVNGLLIDCADIKILKNIFFFWQFSPHFSDFSAMSQNGGVGDPIPSSIDIMDMDMMA